MRHDVDFSTDRLRSRLLVERHTVAPAQPLVLAEQRMAQLDVLHVSRARREDPVNAVDLHSRLVVLVADANATRVPTSVLVLYSKAVSAIAEHVAERPADLLVVGAAPRDTIFRSRALPRP